MKEGAEMEAEKGDKGEKRRNGGNQGKNENMTKTE
jgi:hypothetical protein